MEHIEQIQLYVDGGARGNPGPAASAYVVKNAEGEILQFEGKFLGEATNNIAEYTALLCGLDALHKMQIHELAIFSDSELMVKQIIGEYQVRSKELINLFEQVQRKLLRFDRWHIKHIRREQNKDADRLVNETLDRELGSDKSRRTEKEETVEPAGEPETSAKMKEEEEPKRIAKVMVEVLRAPKSGVCPSPMQKGKCFVFSSCVPAGLCVHAAAAILPKVIAMQKNAKKGSSETVVCGEAGCKAEFQLTIL